MCKLTREFEKKLSNTMSKVNPHALSLPRRLIMYSPTLVRLKPLSGIEGTYVVCYS